MKLKPDEIRQRLRIIVYQEQVPVNRLAKDCGMDAKTIAKALNGDMTIFTCRRFEKWFYLKEVRQIERPDIKENYTILASNSQKSVLVKNLMRLFMEKKKLGTFKILSANTLRQKTGDELKVIHQELESTLKWYLLKNNKRIIEKYHIWLLDKWDYWQWKEKLILTSKDLPK